VCTGLVATCTFEQQVDSKAEHHSDPRLPQVKYMSNTRELRMASGCSVPLSAKEKVKAPA
jgi:hypothetical protein